MHQNAGQYIALICAGLLWGFTNPFIKRGVAAVQRKQRTRRTGISFLDAAFLHITTKAFIIPQLFNLCGTVLFTKSLATGQLSVAIPLANGVSLAANAAADFLLGRGFAVGPGLFGLLLITAGITLCSL